MSCRFWYGLFFAMSCAHLFGQEGAITLDSLLQKLNSSTSYHVSLGSRLEGDIKVPSYPEHLSSPSEIMAHCGLLFRQIDNNIVITQMRKYFLSGFVRDANSNTELIGAHIFTEKGKGTTTDEFGYFQLQVQAGPTTLTSSYLGYRQSSKVLQIRSDQNVSFSLKSSISLPAITISSDWATDNRSRSARLDLSELSGLPSLETTVDLGRYLQFQSGITAGADGLGGLHVRGGSADQNLYLIDGIPIFNPYHMLGTASLFNTSVLKHATFHKGGFSSRHGGRLSSVLEVTLNGGNSSHLKGNFGLSRSNLQGVLEGPIGNKATFMVAGSATAPGDFIGRGLSKGLGDANINLRYRDLFAKVTRDMGAKNQLQMTLYRGRNQLQERDSFYYMDDDAIINSSQNDRYRWGNTAGSLRWQKTFTPSFYGRLTLLHTQFNYESISLIRDEVQEIIESERIDFLSSTRQSSIQLHFDKVMSADASLNFGTAFNHHHFTPGIAASLSSEKPSDFDENFRSPIRQDLFDRFEFTSREWNTYVEYNRVFNSLWNVQLGLRSSLYQQDKELMLGLRPRLRVLRDLSETSHLELSLGQLQQNQHVISTLDNAYPNELYVPATAEHPVQVSSVVDLMYAWKKKNLSLAFGGFYKRMHNLLAFKPRPDFLTPARLDNVDASTWQEDVLQGYGEAYGFESSGQLRSSQHSITLTYTYARSWRYFEDLFADYEIPYIFDRPHSINILGTSKLGKKWQLGYAWQFGSGTTLPLTDGNFEVYDAADAYVYEYEVLEDEVVLHFYESYHRLDLSIGYSSQGERLTHLAKLAMTNIYNRVNPATSTFWFDEDGDQVTTQAGLPRMMQLSYLVRF